MKAAWRVLTDRDTSAMRARYYIVHDANVFDVAANKCISRDIALVGFHIVTKTPHRRNGFGRRSNRWTTYPG